MDHLQNAAQLLQEANHQIAQTREALLGEAVMIILLTIEAVIGFCMTLIGRDIKAVPMKGLIYHWFPNFSYLLFFID